MSAGTLVAIMLIWIGDMRGGPATIEFTSLPACEAARPVIEREFPRWNTWQVVETRCVEVRR